jgi:ssDNA thymidine ADP-ribosyltransferase, DarT
VAECIHGFEDGLCDICFPRKVPEPVTAAGGTPTRTRASRVTSARPKRSIQPHAATATLRLPAFGSRRLYHVTHARNLESILLDGAIRSIASGADPDVDVSAPVVRELRANADVGDGRKVAEFVPFALSPDTERWAELRDGATGSHWSTAARLAGATEYTMLVVAANKLGEDIVIADGDASAPATVFDVDDAAKAIARAARADPELGAVELLVPGQVTLDAMLLIGVPNEPMRLRVRRMFDSVDATPPRIVVHPPWFTPVED